MHPELEHALKSAAKKGSHVRILTNLAGANYPSNFLTQPSLISKPFAQRAPSFTCYAPTAARMRKP